MQVEPVQVMETHPDPGLLWNGTADRSTEGDYGGLEGGTVGAFEVLLRTLVACHCFFMYGRGLPIKI